MAALSMVSAQPTTSEPNHGCRCGDGDDECGQEPHAGSQYFGDEKCDYGNPDADQADGGRTCKQADEQAVRMSAGAPPATQGDADWNQEQQRESDQSYDKQHGEFWSVLAR